MPCTRLPTQVFGELKSGKRAQGGPKKHYKDTLKSSKNFKINLNHWRLSAKDRPVWSRMQLSQRIPCSDWSVQPSANTPKLIKLRHALVIINPDGRTRERDLPISYRCLVTLVIKYLKTIYICLEDISLWLTIHKHLLKAHKCLTKNHSYKLLQTAQERLFDS